MPGLLASIALCALALWLLFGAITALGYRLVGPTLRAIDPGQASRLLLAWLAIPPVAAALTCGVLYSPDLAQWLVAGHCHLGSCAQHGPRSTHALWPAALLLGWTAFRVGQCLYRQWLPARRLGNQLRRAGQENGDFIWLDTPEPAAFTLGWFRPRIFITSGMGRTCSQAEIDCIVHHERAHRQRRDNIRLLLARLFSAPLPQAWTAAAIDDLKLCCEQACDSFAAHATSRETVATAILRIARVQQSAAPAGSLGFVGRHTERRVQALLATPPAPLAEQRVFAATSAVVLFILFLIDPLHRALELLP